eukprot:1014089-Alexandrium_andersonii.AAC.1
MRGAGSGCEAALSGVFTPWLPLDDAMPTRMRPTSSRLTGSESPAGRASLVISVPPTSFAGDGEHVRLDWATSGWSLSASSDFRTTP